MIITLHVKTKENKVCLEGGETSLGRTERGAWQQKNQNQYSVTTQERRSLTMKKTVKNILLAVASLMAFTFIIGCDRETVVEDEPSQVPSVTSERTAKKPLLPEEFSEYGLKAYPKGIITIDDFRATGKLITREEAERLIKAKKLGESPENAVVGLIFHADGSLYTPHEFNSSGVKEDFLLNNDKYQWTVDLRTFYKVTGLNESTGDYARNFEAFWLFDPYVKFYETRAERERLGRSNHLKSLSMDSYQDFLKKGNMLYGEWQWWSPGGYTGHTAGIVNYPNFGDICYTGDNALKRVIIVEGLPFSGVVEHCPIYNYNNRTDWRSSNTTKRYVMYTTTVPTAEQRDRLQEFQENQLGKSWRFPSNSWTAQANKEKNGSFYCSKLQWLAYKTVMSLDIDRDGGGYVFPRDILYDDDVSYIAF